jgi:hypothetical protein
MNHTLQAVLAWFGAFSALGYIALAAWICAASAIKGRGPEPKHAARRTPITEAEIAAVDIDAELANLTKENGR